MSMETANVAGLATATAGAGAKRPQLPNNFFKFPVAARLKAVQQFISSFEYKNSPQTSFNTHKFRPLARIMDTAKMMIYSPQPIKCVEAVFLALYLTAGMPDVDRIPLGFKTQNDSTVHQHIVLVVRFGGKYGAFGISRRPELMNKEFEFDSMSSIVDNYKRAYKDCQHSVLKIRLGLPVEHNVDSYNFICWRHLSLTPLTQSWEECCAEMEKHVQQAKKLWEKWLLDGQDGALKNLNIVPKHVHKELKPPKKEEEINVKVKTVTTKCIRTTKIVPDGYVYKDLTRPGSRSRMCKIISSTNGDSGKRVITERSKTAISSVRKRRKCSLLLDPKRPKSARRKYALKGRSIELMSDSEGGNSLVVARVSKRHTLRPGKLSQTHLSLSSSSSSSSCVSSIELVIGRGK